MIIVPKHHKLGEGFSRREILDSQEHPGRQNNARRSGYQTNATWITQLIDLKKPVILCGFCRPKFDPKAHRYRRFFCLDSNGQNGFITDGRCDDCKQDTRLTPGRGTMFIPEEHYPQLCHEPGVARRSVRARIASAGQSAYQFIQSLRS
jgi:hypothetical protein